MKTVTNAPRILLAGLLVAPVSAQWDRMDRQAPGAVECSAAALYQVERWDRAVVWFGKLLQQEPDNAFAWHFLAESLLHDGHLDEARTACERAAGFDATRAHALHTLAAIEAARGDVDAGIDALRAAVRAGYVSPEPIDRDADLKALRGHDDFAAIARSCTPLAERFAALADADDHDGLVGLCRAANHTWYEKQPVIVVVIQEILEARMKALGRRTGAEEAERLARRARRGAAAADEATEASQGAFAAYVESILALDDGEREAYRKSWSQLRRLGGAVRTHRFEPIIREIDACIDRASQQGDVLALRDAHYVAGLSHTALVDHGQSRKGVTREEELDASARHFKQVLDLSQRLGDIEGIVDGVDFLATIDNMVPKRTANENIRAIWRGIVLSCRLEKQKRELGMWESMWRTALERTD